MTWHETIEEYIGGEVMGYQSLDLEGQKRVERHCSLKCGNFETKLASLS
jgi:hypothetical protein